jgi:hypothetical protein
VAAAAGWALPGKIHNRVTEADKKQTCNKILKPDQGVKLIIRD